MASSEIKNRIGKNFKKLKGFLKQEGVEAYRIYDRDIPAYPFIIDIYKGYAVIYERGSRDVDGKVREQHLLDIKVAIKEVLNIEDADIILKERKENRGSSQYVKQSKLQKEFVINEYGASYIVNLYDYLDTGLFLDHRPFRKKLKKISMGKRVLNLFCYTGSISVAAALNGGLVTSVDKSSNYLEWAKRNFDENSISLSNHKFMADDTLTFLKRCRNKYDLIFLDPPTFSNESKKGLLFEVEKDQFELITLAMDSLEKSGVLFFSNNKKKFKLDTELLTLFDIKDITRSSIPRDFRDNKIHQLYEIRHRS